jgi:hypothetical protein
MLGGIAMKKQYSLEVLFAELKTLLIGKVK